MRLSVVRDPAQPRLVGEIAEHAIVVSPLIRLDATPEAGLLLTRHEGSSGPIAPTWNVLRL
jgi:hypothetical protein